MADENVKIKFRAVIEFLTLENNAPSDIYDRMVKIYQDQCPSYATIKRWSAEFRRGRKSLEDDPRSGRPVTSTTSETIEAVENIVAEDRRVTIRQIEATLGISFGSVGTILHEHLGMNKVCARWVPRMLTPEMKNQRIQCSAENLQLMNLDWEKFQRRFITGDETWLHHYDPESKLQSKGWKHLHSPPLKNFELNRLPAKSCAQYFTMVKVSFILTICLKRCISVVNITLICCIVCVEQLLKNVVERCPLFHCCSMTMLRLTSHTLQELHC